VRPIEPALVDEVWRETTSYPPGRIDEEARDFLTRQPHVAAFAHAMTREQDAVVQRAALGLCFLLFKVLERSLGRPFPLLAEARLHAAHEAVAQWLATHDPEAGDAVDEAAGPPGHPTLAAYIVSAFYGGSADTYDERVRAGLLLMLRTLTSALDIDAIDA
jgi:hypothetical protein